MENLDGNQNNVGNNGNQFNSIDQNIGENILGSNEAVENVQEGYDSFRSLELEELEKEFDRLFGTFTENEPEIAETVVPNIENNINTFNTNGEVNQKTNVFGNYKTGVNLGEHSTGVFGNYGINNSVNTEIGANLNTNNTSGTATGVFGNYEINQDLNNSAQSQQQGQNGQQAVTVVKKGGFWAKIKAFFTGITTTTAKNQAAPTQVGYNQNLNGLNTNGQANNNSTSPSSAKGFWSIFKGNK